MRSEPAQQTPELPPGTRIQPAECETHGHYDQKIFPVLGKELKSGCPEHGRAHSYGVRNARERLFSINRPISAPKSFSTPAAVRRILSFLDVLPWDTCRKSLTASASRITVGARGSAHTSSRFD